MTELTLSSEASVLVAQYKGVIRGLDTEINTLKDTVRHLEARNEQLEKSLSQVQATNTQLSDQNLLLRAQLAAAAGPSAPSEEMEVATQSVHSENIRLNKELESLREKLAEETRRSSAYADDLTKFHKDQEDLLELLTDQENKITKYAGQLKSAGIEVEEETDIEVSEEKQNDRSQII